MANWDKMLAEGPCRVTFRKKDGTIRVMNCSREDEAIEAAGGAGTGGSSPNVMTVVDLDKNAWRCFKPETVLRFESLAPAAS